MGRIRRAVEENKCFPELAESFVEYVACSQIFHCTPSQLDGENSGRVLTSVAWHLAIKEKEAREMEKAKHDIRN